jgi:hypothetical protein
MHPGKALSASVPPKSSHTAHPAMVDRRIDVKGEIRGASPWEPGTQCPPMVLSASQWEPGTQGMYPRSTNAQRSNLHPTSLPVWNPRVSGMGWQQAMFSVANSFEPLSWAGKAAHTVLVQPSTFYVAADV